MVHKAIQNMFPTKVVYKDKANEKELLISVYNT